MGLAPVEEGVAQAVAAIGRQQDRLGAIEDVAQRLGPVGEGGGKILGVVLHRRAGGGADHARAVPGRDHDGAGAGIGAQIVALIGRIAVIQIGPVAEDRDAQAREVVQRGGHRVSGQGLGPDHPCDTCRVQSDRL